MPRNDRELITRKIEMLPINVVYRNMAQVNFAAAEVGVASVVVAVTWLCALFVSAAPVEK